MRFTMYFNNVVLFTLWVFTGWTWYHLGTLLIYGRITIGESSPVIRSLEFLFLSALLVVGAVVISGIAWRLRHD